MADQNENIKEPEIIPLPESQAPQKQVSTFEDPYFIVLARQKQQNKEVFENSRRNARVERIKAIQKLRGGTKVVVYYSIDTLSQNDSEILFDLLQSVGKQKRLDLFLLSPGGFADPAFKMATMCRDFAEEKFGVIIPHYAKSAATLLCLGSDELVMGTASEIGPTDPRIEIKDEYGRKINVSATSVEDALKVLEEYTKGDPVKSLKYMPLLEKINLNTLGEYRRALSSSKQYAEELLKTGGLLKDKKRFKAIATKLATKYYSHGYPIRSDVASNELGFNTINPDKELWQAIWQLHKLYDAMIKDSRDGKTMVTTIFEAEEFTMPITKLIITDEQSYEEKTGK
jgi:hypothetical protein